MPPKKDKTAQFIFDLVLNPLARLPLERAGSAYFFSALTLMN
jgi:hypothetical protein